MFTYQVTSELNKMFILCNVRTCGSDGTCIHILSETEGELTW